jgi:hypothetical protein
MTIQASNSVTFVLLSIALALSILAFFMSSALEEEQVRKAMSHRRTIRKVVDGTSHQPPLSLHDDNDNDSQPLGQNLMRNSYLEALSAQPHYVVLVPIQESSVRATHITPLRIENVQVAQVQKMGLKVSPDSPLPSGLTSNLAMMMGQNELRESPFASVADEEQTHPTMKLNQRNENAKSTAGTSTAAGSTSSWPLIKKFPYTLTAIFVLGLAIINFLDRVARQKEVMAKFRDDDSDVSSFSTGLKYSNSPRDVGYGTIAITELFDGSFDKFDL